MKRITVVLALAALVQTEDLYAEASFLDENAVGRFKRAMGTSRTYEVRGQTYTPTQLSAFVLKKLIQDTKEAIGPIADVIVSIPANFANEARDATLAAAKEAGFDIKYIVNEPTAAALYYAGVELDQTRSSSHVDIVTPKQVVTSKGRFFRAPNSEGNSRQ